MTGEFSYSSVHRLHVWYPAFYGNDRGTASHFFCEKFSENVKDQVNTELTRMGSEFQQYLESCCSHRGTNGYELAQRIESDLHSRGILGIINLM